MDNAGNQIVTYTYDAWDNILDISGSHASTIGQYNPLRYRGYVYDTESNLYYLQSRYYDPAMGRFLNTDNYPTTGQGLTGNNMFAYCGNNPVSREDNGGEFWNVVIGAVIGATLSAASELASQLINHVATGENIDWGDIATSAVGGAVYGGVMAATGSNTAATVASTVTSSIISGIRDGDSAGDIMLSTAMNTAVAVATCVTPKVINKSLSGKYVKLNKVQKWIKQITDTTYSGKYESSPNHLPEVFTSGLEDFGKGVAKTTAQLFLSII